MANLAKDWHYDSTAGMFVMVWLFGNYTVNSATLFSKDAKSWVLQITILSTILCCAQLQNKPAATMCAQNFIVSVNTLSWQSWSCSILCNEPVGGPRDLFGSRWIRLFGSWLKRGEGIDFSLYYYHKTHLARSTITHNHQLQLPIRRFLFGVRHVFGLAWAEAIRRAKVSGPELVTSFHWHIFSKTYSDLWRHTTKIFLPRLPRDSNKFNCRTKQTELSQRRPDYNSILNQSAF